MPTENGMRYWLVTFDASGSIESIAPVSDDAGGRDTIIVRAETKEQARKKAYNFYCARKKKLAKERLLAQGRCSCGRPWDRQHPSGAPMRTCSVCAENQRANNRRHKERISMRQQGETPPPRDETARVEKNLARQRDRRAEIRLETLVAVKKAWLDAPTIGVFGAWLQSEISKLTTEKKQTPTVETNQESTAA